MKRKKIIKGAGANATVTITIDLETYDGALSRLESLRMMDALASKAMGLFQHTDVPYFNVPLVRLEVR